MAQFDIHGFDEISAELDRLGRFDEIAPKILEGAVSILEEEVQKQVVQHWVSGDMAKSVKKTGATAGKNGGYYICVRPTGKDQKGVRNMEKMVWLEHGVKGRAAVPVLTTAVLNAQAPVLAKMREIFEREVNGT